MPQIPEYTGPVIGVQAPIFHFPGPDRLNFFELPVRLRKPEAPHGQRDRRDHRERLHYLRRRTITVVKLLESAPC